MEDFWYGMEENCQYGIWKNRLPFHSIPCPANNQSLASDSAIGLHSGVMISILGGLKPRIALHWLRACYFLWGTILA